MIRDLRRLKENEDVKAVVLRVNSPGGSAFGSEQIWYAVTELKKEKPVIVSMGDYAASGGYYISCNADSIVADPTTLTGSIGIFGMFPNVKGLTDKIGLSFDVVKTNTYSDFGMMGRALNDGEKALMQNMVNEGYELFVKRCAEGRGMTTDEIKKIAEGRVDRRQSQRTGLGRRTGRTGQSIGNGYRKGRTGCLHRNVLPRQEEFLRNADGYESGWIYPISYAERQSR